MQLITEYFKQWCRDVARAEALLTSNEYFLEGVLVLSCYIGALARARFPQETKDWKSYKNVVWEYSGQKNIYENIDLLFFCQWPSSKCANDKVYKCIKNHSELASIFKSAFGGEDEIKSDPNKRYQKREKLISSVKNKNSVWFDESNFQKHIELFSNNQILYRFMRGEAVHNFDFPLFNATYIPGDNKHTYTDNHQVSRDVILATVKNIVGNMEKECLGKNKWPWELPCV
ncbi:MAG: hypothetical protein ACOY3Z_03015 [Thermodesulfobacteriota bacterium]